MEIKKILEMCVQYRASDVHILVGTPPSLRLNGQLVVVPDSQVVTPAIASELISPLMSQSQRELVQVDRELDFSYSLNNGARFRTNVYYEKGNLAAALRYIPNQIKSLEELGLPQLLGRLTLLKQGLILVTGPTGHGKSTTLAAMIERINNERGEHIVTIEDPIEFIHKNKKSIVKQREVFSDTKSFSNALRHALREDPNVIVVGEMRDLETISTALTAAETGHLVLATLHTPNAPQTIQRIIDVFPSTQQTQIKLQLADCIQAVVSQLLLPHISGKGRVIATEIMVATAGIRNLIREQEIEQIPTLMQTGAQFGMRTMDKSLKELVKEGLVSLEAALEKVKHPDEFRNL